MEFKDKVRQAREQMVLSQVEFAEELGVAFATVNRWENGVRKPTFAMQRKFNSYCKENQIDFHEKAETEETDMLQR